MTLESTNNRALPFEFDKGLSYKQITKKFKIITNSSDQFNGYMKKYFKIPKLNLNMIKEAPQKLMSGESTLRSENQNINTNNSNKILPFVVPSLSTSIVPVEPRSMQKLYSLQSLSTLDNQTYMDYKHQNVCESISKHKVIRNSKIKTHFSNDKNIRNLLAPLNYNLHSKIKMTQTLNLNTNDFLNREDPNFYYMNNLFDLFYTDRKYNKTNILYERIKIDIEKIEKRINENIKYYTEEGTLTKTLDLTTTFNKDTKNEIRLKIKPLKLYFNVKDKCKEKVKIPFELVPFIFLLDMRDLIQFLFFIIKFDNKIEKDTLVIKYTKSKVTEVNDNILINENGLKHAFLKMKNFVNNEDKDLENNTGLKLSNLTDESKMETIEFSWITKDVVYDIKLKLPKIKLFFEAKNTLIEKTIDKDYIMFLYYNNFENWEFYTVNYLILLKRFRLIMNKIFTKANKMFYTYNEEVKKISIDEPGKETHFSQSFDDNSYHFIFTNAYNTNFLFKVLGYNVNVKNSINHNNQRFYLNLKHSMVVYKLSFLIKIENILMKVFNITKDGKITFDSQMLNNFDDEFIKYSQNYNLHNSYSIDFSKVKKIIKYE